MTDTTEFVVPRSIPMILLIIVDFLSVESPRLLLALSHYAILVRYCQVLRPSTLGKSPSIPDSRDAASPLRLLSWNWRFRDEFEFLQRPTRRCGPRISHSSGGDRPFGGARRQ